MSRYGIYVLARARREYAAALAWWRLSGDVPLTVEIEVAAQLAPRGFSGCLSRRSRHAEDCQEELCLPRRLERQLSTTNAIENLIGSLRILGGRVKGWRGGRMILRWTVTAVADAASRFRRVTGAREGMVRLLRALTAHDVNHRVESRTA